MQSRHKHSCCQRISLSINTSCHYELDWRPDPSKDQKAVVRLRKIHIYGFSYNLVWIDFWVWGNEFSWLVPTDRQTDRQTHSGHEGVCKWNIHILSAPTVCHLNQTMGHLALRYSMLLSEQQKPLDRKRMPFWRASERDRERELERERQSRALKI